MAIFGYDRYGSPTVYGGAVVSSSGFALSNISIREISYGAVTLNWSVTGTYSRLRLVRSRTGFPNTEDDGLVVREVSSTAPSATHTDRGLTPGTTYYYAFFVETDIPTWSSTVTYTKGSVVKSAGNVVYVSLQDANLNHVQTDTVWWATITVDKKWTSGGQTAILVTKRFDFTTKLYDHLPQHYRGDDIDWVEPSEADKLSGVGPSTYPDLAKFLAIFGMELDGIQTKYENLVRITNPAYTPQWYLEAQAASIGVTLETSVSSRLHRQRIQNAAYLARRRGTKTGVQDELTSVLGWDSVVTVGVNKILNVDMSTAYYPIWDVWDAAGSYFIGDYVQKGSAIYLAILNNNGASMGPPAGGNNTWWVQQLWSDLPATTLLQRETGSYAGWIPANRALGSVVVTTGATNPLDSTYGNAFRVTNISAGTATVDTKLANTFYAPTWSVTTEYAKGDLVTYNSKIWKARSYSLGQIPTDDTNWVLRVDRVLTEDPEVIYTTGIPVTASASWTASAYVMTATGLTGASAAMAIDWYTDAGVFISSSLGTASAITGAWTRRTVTATSPATAKYALLRVSATAVVSGGRFVFKHVQMQTGTSATTYELPRRLDFLIRPDRTNHVTNPALRSAATNWTADVGTTGVVTQARQTGQTGWTQGLTTSYRATWTTATTAVTGGVGYGSTTALPVVAGEQINARIQARSSKIQRVSLVIKYYTAADALISSDISSPIVLAAATVTDLTHTSVAPATADHIRVYVLAQVGTSGTNWAVNDWIEATALLVLRNQRDLGYFFDGGRNTSDTYWASTPDASKTYYYQGWARKRYRVDDIIRKSIPHGMPFTTRYADV